MRRKLAVGTVATSKDALQATLIKRAGHDQGAISKTESFRLQAGGSSTLHNFNPSRLKCVTVAAPSSGRQSAPSQKLLGGVRPRDRRAGRTRVPPRLGPKGPVDVGTEGSGVERTADEFPRTDRIR